MKTRLSLTLAAALCCGLFIACNTPKLETGGAYAPTNAIGEAVIAPDIGFFSVESAFKFAHQAVRLAFDIEFENRALCWQISPDIKHTLDRIRPEVNDVILQYALARDTYKANPVPANLTTMNSWLAKLKQLAVTAQGVTANIQKGN